MLTAEQYVETKVDLPKLFAHVEKMRRELWDLARDEENRLLIFVETMVSGAAGTHQLKEVADIFEIALEDNEDPEEWDYTVQPYADKVAKELTKRIGTGKWESLSGVFFFEHLEADSSYGLFYLEEEESEDGE